jgi:hypothetical protein
VSLFEGAQGAQYGAESWDRQGTGGDMNDA